MEEKFVVGMLVANHFGVLNRVAGLFAKRCYNIDSLAVGATENNEFSRITIVAKGDNSVREQVVRQLQKLHDVFLVEIFEQNQSSSIESMLIKLKVSPETKNDIANLINEYNGKVRDFSSESVTTEITGSSELIDKFIEKAKVFEIYEVCRSGLISMSHGRENMLGLRANN